MNLSPRERSTRHALVTGVLVAAAIVVASACLDVPWIALGLFPGLWAVLQARSPRCAPCAR